MTAAIHFSVAQKPILLAIFALTYLGIAAGRVPGLKLDRTGIVMLGAIAMMVFSGLPAARVVGFIDWPTILLLFGFFVISAQLRLSGFFDAVAAGISRRLAQPARFLLVLMLATAGLSAFLNHDIVCFVFTPIIAEALSRRQLDAVPFLVALAVASNIGAGATLVGNPQGMMIAQITGLAFAPYVAWCLMPVLFALGGAYGIIWLLSRRRWGKAAAVRADTDTMAQPLDRAHTIKGLVILVLVIGLFFTTLPKEIVALTAAGIHLASPKFRTKELLGLVDWPILVLFMSLFVVTGVFQATGYGDQLVLWLAHRGFELSAPPNLVWVTASLSNLISNSAAVMLLLKVAHLSGPVAAYVLALANSFGGSLLIVGSVSNIIMVHQARERGVTVSFWNFARLGIPITVTALAGLIAWEMLMR